MLYFIRFDYFKVTDDFANKNFLWAFPINIDGYRQYTLSLCINEYHLHELKMIFKPNEVTYWRKEDFKCQTLYTIKKIMSKKKKKRL